MKISVKGREIDRTNISDPTPVPLDAKLNNKYIVMVAKNKLRNV
jgi:hypothetical protein